MKRDAEIDIDAAWEAIEFEESADVSNLVYCGDVPPLTPGDVITVQGHVDRTCERFYINLISIPDKITQTEDKDVALHINPRLLQRYIVRNTKVAGVWGKEETAAPVAFPMRREGSFAITIFIADESFFIQINGIHFCQYAFRVPLSKINEVQVRGDKVKVDQVLRGHSPSYPSGKPPPPVADEKPCSITKTWENPSTCILQEGLLRGKQVVVCGRIKILPHSFSINLQSSVHLWPHPDIALHFNPRFMQSSKQQVIWNSWCNGWGKELRTDTSILVPGGSFQLRIQREHEQYSVWEKEQLVGVFTFRCSPDNVKAVYIYGDADISDIYVEDSPAPIGSFDEDF